MERRGIRSLSADQLAWAVMAGLVGVHIVLGVLLFDPKPFVGGDNAGYMILAESIETGQGYTDLYLPDTPRHTKYPPFYPAVLAVTGKFGGGLIAFKIISLMSTAASVIVLFLLGRKRLGREGGLAVAAAFAFNPVLLYYSHWVLSEAPFVLLTLAGLWAAQRMEESWRWLAAATVAALLAYLTRSAGLPLIAALLLALGWQRLWRQLAAVASASVAVVGGWWLWGALAASRSAEQYSSNFLLIDPYNPGLGYLGPGDLVARTVNNIRVYAIDVLPESLAGVAPGSGVNPLAVLAALLLIALALVAWVRGIRKFRVLELFVALYAGLIFVWPQVWTDRRFLLPLLPVLYVLAAAGIIWCFDFLRTKRRVWALPVLGMLLVLLTLPDHVRSVGFNQTCMRFYRQGDSLSCYPPPWRAFVQTAEWVRENTAEESIVVSRKPRLFYYFGGRRGDVYPFTTSDQEMLGFLDKIQADYVIVAGLSATTFRYLIPVIRSVPERFEPRYVVGEGSSPAYVLAYQRPPEQRPGGAGGEEER